MTFRTADLCDRHPQGLQIAEPLFKSFTTQNTFSGPISTIKVFEDSRPLRLMLEEPGNGRVLVIDGGGSKRCALIDRSLAEQAMASGWHGILLYGCVRHSQALSQLPIGLMALNVHPMSGSKHDPGERDILITFAGVNFRKDHYLYADCDGIIVADTKLD